MNFTPLSLIAWLSQRSVSILIPKNAPYFQSPANNGHATAMLTFLSPFH